MGSDELMRRAMADSNHVTQREGATGDGGSAKRERERLIRGAIWTFEVAGITITREEAERALDAANRKPIPEF